MRIAGTGQMGWGPLYLPEGTQFPASRLAFWDELLQAVFLRVSCLQLLLLWLCLAGSKLVTMMTGGKKQVDLANTNSLEYDELANFAVDQHNNQQNSLEKMKFSKLVSAHTQVVQGTMYHLLIEVEEKGQPKEYEAKVWVKPWEKFKKLEEFKPKA